MTLTIGGVLFIAFVFSGSMFYMLSGVESLKRKWFYSVMFGLLFVSPVGYAVEKWGSQNSSQLEKEVKRIPIKKGNEEQFSKILTEQKGVHLYLGQKGGERYYFVPKENIREISTVNGASYLSVFKRYDERKHPYLKPIVKNDEFFVFYRKKE